MIYLDYAASSPVLPEVKEIFLSLVDEFGNPSSAHSAGRRARKILDDARENIASLLGASPDEIIFTSSATESNNTAVNCAEYICTKLKRPALVSAIEHESVLKPAKARLGEFLRTVPVGRDGVVSPEVGTANPCFVSVMMVNNEVGAVQDIAGLVRTCAPCGTFFHSDMTQALGKVSVDLHECGVALASFSAHKIGGIRGAGILYVRRASPFRPLLYGGPQEFEKRAGTENVFAAACFAKAVEVVVRNLESSNVYVREIRRFAAEEIRKGFPDSEMISPASCVPHIMSTVFRGFDGMKMQVALDTGGVCVSSGSACASLAVEPSHVLTAMGFTAEEAASTIRFTFSKSTSKVDIQEMIRIMHDVCGRTRRRESTPRKIIT